MMAAANASPRGQRAAILASPLHELTGFYLAVDCLAPRCDGERTFAVAELATFYGRDSARRSGVASHAMLRRLWRPRRGCLAGDRANPQCTRPTPTGAALGTGGTGVAAADCGAVGGQIPSTTAKGAPRDDWLR